MPVIQINNNDFERSNRAVWETCNKEDIWAPKYLFAAFLHQTFVVLDGGMRLSLCSSRHLPSQPTKTCAHEPKNMPVAKPVQFCELYSPAWCVCIISLFRDFFPPDRELQKRNWDLNDPLLIGILIKLTQLITFQEISHAKWKKINKIFFTCSW